MHYFLSIVADLQSQIQDLQEVNESTVSSLRRAEQQLRQLREDRQPFRPLQLDVGNSELHQENQLLRQRVCEMNSSLNNIFHLVICGIAYLISVIVVTKVRICFKVNRLVIDYVYCFKCSFKIFNASVTLEASMFIKL